MRGCLKGALTLLGLSDGRDWAEAANKDQAPGFDPGPGLDAQPVDFGLLCETTFGFFFCVFVFGGANAFVLTGAVSVAVTLGPDGGVPVAVATLSKLFRTFRSTQL